MKIKTLYLAPKKFNALLALKIWENSKESLDNLDLGQYFLANNLNLKKLEAMDT
jgi:hypothetical protein